jgi:hypothetical protein
MSNLHEHPSECEHQVQYCKKCDVTYCVKCGKEWKVPTYWYYPPWTYTWGTNLTNDEITTSESHTSHDS